MTLQDAIFASKLYKASPRKDKIRAALLNPVNVELVQQLSEHLDDEYKKPPVEEPDTATSVADTNTPPPEGAASDSGTSKSGTSSTPSVAAPSDDELGGEQAPAAPDGGDTSNVVVEVKGEGEPEVEASPKPGEADSKANSASVVNTSPVIASTNIHALPGEIKSTLNMREDCTGVERVMTSGNEMWIYYNDKVNLNSVMSPVIEVLNAASYSYLHFNRLARSDNAIVFEITAGDTSSQVDPIGSTEEE